MTRETVDERREDVAVARQECPDCGEPITLGASGWWTHDGLPGDCWRLSLDGPADPECVR